MPVDTALARYLLLFALSVVTSFQPRPFIHSNSLLPCFLTARCSTIRFNGRAIQFDTPGLAAYAGPAEAAETRCGAGRLGFGRGSRAPVRFPLGPLRQSLRPWPGVLRARSSATCRLAFASRLRGKPGAQLSSARTAGLPGSFAKSRSRLCSGCVGGRRLHEGSATREGHGAACGRAGGQAPVQAVLTQICRGAHTNNTARRRSFNSKPHSLSRLNLDREVGE